MKAFLITLTLLITLPTVMAASDVLLEQKGADLELDKQLVSQKVLKLDDAFLIQLYSSWKATGALENKTNNWFQSIVEHRFESALLNMINIKEEKIKTLKSAAELYLLFKMKHYQTFLGRWLEYSSKTQFLKTELGLALDQVAGPKASEFFIDSGFSLTKKMSEQLKKIEKIPGKLNYSLQALKALRSGEEAIQWIGKLNPNDELRIHLAYSAILYFGRQGKIGASGTLVRKIIEPWIEKEANDEEVAHYYLTLGRLLYQARAFKESVAYYKLIPESSKFFLEARTESLWSHLQTRDFSKSTGELASLKMGVFSKQFYPEIFLASAIGHTMLCQFSDAKKSIHSFVKNNKSWGKKIETAMNADNPVLIRESFLINRMKSQVLSLKQEMNYFKNKKDLNYNTDLALRLEKVNSYLKLEAKQQWKNRYKILDSALYKMKFVRIELLSRMKAVTDGLKKQLPGQDMVKHYQASTLKGNQMAFPDDGMPWGDELFNMNANVVNLCIQGKFYAK